MRNFFSKKIQNIVTSVFYTLIIVVIYFYVKNIDFSELKEIRINWIYLVAAASVGILVRYYSAVVWILVIKYLGAKIMSYVELIYIHAKSALGKYLPGKVTWVLGRLYFSSSVKISKKKLAVSTLFEVGISILVGFALGNLMLLLNNNHQLVERKFMLIFVLLFLINAVFLIPSVFNRIMRFLYKILKKKELDHSVRIRTSVVIRTIIYYILFFVLNGFGMYIIIRSVSRDIGVNQIPYITGVVALASSAGIVSIFAPSGLGVRESINAIFLGIILPKEVVVIVVVLHRILSVISDLGYFFVSKLVQRIFKGKAT